MTKNKTQIPLLFFGLLSLFLIGITFGSCEAEKSFAKDSENGKQMQRSISFQQFKREIGQSQFSNQIGIIPIGNAKTMEDFIIDTSQVKSLERDFIVYSMKLNPKFLTENNKFYDLIVFRDTHNEMIKQIIEYVPQNEITNYDEESIFNYLQNTSKEVIFSSKTINSLVTAPCVVERWEFVCNCTGQHNFNDTSCTCSSFHSSVSISVVDCTTNGGGDSGGPGDGGGGNTGSGGSADPLIEPYVYLPNIKETALDDEANNSNPCEEMNSKDADSTFNSKMVELKGKAGTQNFESSYVVYQNPQEGTTFSNEIVANPEDKSGGREVKIDLNQSASQATTNTIAIIHCHLDDGTTFKVPSFTDLITLAAIATLSTRPTQELAMYVTTASGTFAVKVNNRILLKSKLDLMAFSQNSYEKDFKDKVKMEQTVEIQKLKLLQFINNMNFIGNPGIDLYEKKASTGQWNKLSLSNNGNNIIETPCN